MMSSPEARPGGNGPVDGVRVRLSDGGSWTLLYRDPFGNDPEYDALLQAVFEAEDRAEGLRAELALTILLLDREYKLPPDRLSSLLSFEPESPALTALQAAVHDLVLVSMERSRAVSARLQDTLSPRMPGTAPQGSSPVRARPLGSIRLF